MPPASTLPLLLKLQGHRALSPPPPHNIVVSMAVAMAVLHREPAHSFLKAEGEDAGAGNSSPLQSPPRWEGKL